jgi:hypothetical protein
MKTRPASERADGATDSQTPDRGRSRRRARLNEKPPNGFRSREQLLAAHVLDGFVDAHALKADLGAACRRRTVVRTTTAKFKASRASRPQVMLSGVLDVVLFHYRPGSLETNAL